MCVLGQELDYMVNSGHLRMKFTTHHAQQFLVLHLLLFLIHILNYCLFSSTFFSVLFLLKPDFDMYFQPFVIRSDLHLHPELTNI